MFQITQTVPGCNNSIRAIVAAVLLLPVMNMAAMENIMVITASIVNLREKPSVDAPVLLKLAQGRIVTEIQRQNDWIEIQVDNLRAGSGWVHESLLSYIELSELTPEIDSQPDSDNFIAEFDKLNDMIKQQAGFVPFTRAEVTGADTLTVTATPEWSTATQKQREDFLSAVFKLWSDAVEPGISITVQVLDQNNDYHMMMFR